ncbi:hypothetical protein D3C75_1090550 [compost metagenome]
MVNTMATIMYLRRANLRDREYAPRVVKKRFIRVPKTSTIRVFMYPVPMLGLISTALKAAQLKPRGRSSSPECWISRLESLMEATAT